VNDWELMPFASMIVPHKEGSGSTKHFPRAARRCPLGDPLAASGMPSGALRKPAGCLRKRIGRCWWPR
jgi:hypothetical protein